MIIAFNKPYGVISQFTVEVKGQKTLADFKFPKGVYPVGRLDLDSEGLLLLSDEKPLVDYLLNPRNEHPRTYHVQVEGEMTENSLKKLTHGILIQGRKTKPCMAKKMDDPKYPERNPPIRFRKTVPTSWMEVKLIEGKNRQIRRMTAAVGFPTLRLIRVAIGKFQIHNLSEGKWETLTEKSRELLRS